MKLKTKKPPLPLILALAVGIGVSGGSWWYLQKHMPAKPNTTKVIVAAKDIEANHSIEPSDLSETEMLPQNIDPKGIKDPSQIIGKVALTGISRGEQFNPDKITDPKLILGADEREVAVPIKDLAQVVGNSLKIGSTVDVYWVVNPDTPGALVAQNARLLELRTKDGQPIREEAPKTALQAGVQQVTGNGQQQVPGIVVLAVKNDQVANITRSVAGGSIVLAKVNDQQAPTTQTPVNTAPAPQPQPQPQPQQPTPGQ